MSQKDQKQCCVPSSLARWLYSCREGTAAQDETEMQYVLLPSQIDLMLYELSIP